jgi:hypothetical protein
VSEAFNVRIPLKHVRRILALLIFPSTATFVFLSSLYFSFPWALKKTVTTKTAHNTNSI